MHSAFLAGGGFWRTRSEQGRGPSCNYEKIKDSSGLVYSVRSGSSIFCIATNERQDLQPGKRTEAVAY